MTKLPSNVVEFAAGDTSLFESFRDYWNQYRSENGVNGKKYSYSTTDSNGKAISFAEKESLLNAQMIREIGKRSGVDFTSMPLEQAVNHPLVAWSAGLIASQMIDAILPETIIDSIGAYAEVRVIGYGESALFDISSRDLFPVSKAGKYGMREAEVHKGYKGQVTLLPEVRQITVGVNLFRVLAGQESLAQFTMKALRSIETEMAKDAYNAFYAAMIALDTTATTGLRVTGYTQLDLIKLAQKVSSFSGGAAPLLIGTKAALSQVFPDDANYRYDLESPFVKLGYLRTIAGINTFELPQVADWTNPFATLLTDSYLFIVAPGTDKLVKVVIGGAMISNVNNTFDNATLTQNATMWKAWRAGVVTSSVAATISL
jgi:hypothetical protein